MPDAPQGGGVDLYQRMADAHRESEPGSWCRASDKQYAAMAAVVTTALASQADAVDRDLMEAVSESGLHGRERAEAALLSRLAALRADRDALAQRVGEVEAPREGAEPALIQELREGVPLCDNPNLRNEWGAELLGAWNATHHEPGSGLALIAGERRRQVEVEGWSPEHDDQHGNGEIAEAAACYAIPSLVRRHWPWSPEWFKSGERIRDLTKAGALIAAEIDRLNRAALAGRKGEGT